MRFEFLLVFDYRCPPDVTFWHPKNCFIHKKGIWILHDYIFVVIIGVCMRSGNVWCLSRKCWFRALLGVECQFLSGWKPSVTETLNHYSLIELELYYFSWLFAGTTESLLINLGMSAGELVSEGKEGGGWDGEWQKGWVSEVMKFPRGLSIPELGTLMNEQNSPITLEI